MPFDSDGAGDWTVAGLHTEYSPEQWAAVRASFATAHGFFLPRAHIADEGGKHRRDPVRTVQLIAGWAMIAGVVMPVLVIIAVMVMLLAAFSSSCSQSCSSPP